MATFLERAWRAALEPLERVDPYPQLSSGLRSALEPELEARGCRRRVVAANPVLFPEPESDESWATRGVLGEQLWTAERPRDLSMLINITSAASCRWALDDIHEAFLHLGCSLICLNYLTWYIDG